MQSVMPNIGLDSFIDDLSSVGSQGRIAKTARYCLVSASKAGSIEQQQHLDNNQPQPTRQVTQEKR